MSSPTHPARIACLHNADRLFSTALERERTQLTSFPWGCSSAFWDGARAASPSLQILLNVRQQLVLQVISAPPRGQHNQSCYCSGHFFFVYRGSPNRVRRSQVFLHEERAPPPDNAHTRRKSSTFGVSQPPPRLFLGWRPRANPSAHAAALSMSLICP